MGETPDGAVLRIIVVTFVRGLVVVMAAMVPAMLLVERDLTGAQLIAVAGVGCIVWLALLSIALRPLAQETSSCQSPRLLPLRKH